MKNSLLFLLFFALNFQLTAQTKIDSSFEPSVAHPFGLANPDAPEQVKDFDPMIGLCMCKSLQRNPDGSWQDTLNMLWKFKYIMNGTAVQDEVWRENDLYAGSIRQYQPDSAKWVVTYFSYPSVSTKPGVWLGNKQGNKIVLTQDQTAPNGMKGYSRLTFHNMRAEGFDWSGEWVSEDGSVVYPFWNIFCSRKRN